MTQKYSTGSGLKFKVDGTRETLEDAETRVWRRRAGWIAGAVVSTFLAVGGAAGCADNAEFGRRPVSQDRNQTGAQPNRAVVSDSTKSVENIGFGVLLVGGLAAAAAFAGAASKDKEKLDQIRDGIRYRDEHRAWRAKTTESELQAPSNDK